MIIYNNTTGEINHAVPITLGSGKKYYFLVGIGYRDFEEHTAIKTGDTLTIIQANEYTTTGVVEIDDDHILINCYRNNNFTNWKVKIAKPKAEQMIIDWDCEKAKGKDYCLYYNESNYIFCTQKPINNGECWLVERTPAVRCFTLHERPKAEQMKETIYTKEMHERGQCCEVGMLFETEAGRYKSLFQNETSVVFEDENYFLVAISRGLIKPIDTRTDREKAIDDLVRLATTNTEFSKSYASDLFDYIKLGKIHGITFTGDK